jgi:hypothetical protein
VQFAMCNGEIERSISEPVSNSDASCSVTDAIFTSNQGGRVPDGTFNNPESRTLDLVEAARDSSTSESRQSSVIATVSQSSKTSLSPVPSD